MDGAEHSGILKGVMAVVQIACNSARRFGAITVGDAGRKHRSDPVAERRSDRRETASTMTAQIDAQLLRHAPVSDTQAVV
jgi:hypothetical protein